ncbi:TonB-dependent receptor [Pseudomonas sp. 21LCFQ02]|uniref:TonB-dependent siderophore receptor n=1 Tax=Pseudomonas sp. 21LCFQ02 TaxID=2957505 RepID=UPI00209AF3AD|nr:TonB-dependent receptor [Pseudomonas sp. 21LCFQ02]MCO8170955.1 TonB-dependent receptor [Pseudomonas sp. 21LCFQ02]
MGYLRGSVWAPCLALGMFSAALATPVLAQETTRYELPAGALDQVLLKISRQGGVPISFEQQALRAITSSPVNGELTVDQALDQALRGTGLRRVQSDAGVSIERSALPVPGETRLSTVTVTGEQKQPPKIVAGALGSASDLQTPFSTRQVSGEQLKERQVKSLNKVFSEDTSVVARGDSYSFNAYSVSVRGLPLDDGGSYKINGSPIIMTTVELPLEAFDSVQLLKGASGFMYGFGAPGGVINYVTKKPTDQTRLSLDVGTRSNGVWSEHLDTSGRVGAEGGLGYRFNAVHEEGETYSHSNVHRDAFSLSLDADLAPNLAWTADLLYQDRLVNGGVQNFRLNNYSGTSLPNAISGRKDLSAYDDTFFQSRIWLATSGLRWSFTPDWSLAVDYSHFEQQRKFAGEYIYLQNKGGDFTDYLNTGHGRAIYDQVQAMLQGNFSTGPIGHKAVLGVSWQGYKRRSSIAEVLAPIGTNNLYTSINPLSYGPDIDFSTYRRSYTEQRAVFASDTLDLTHGWSLLAGLRLTEYTVDSYAIAGNRTSRYHETPMTPTVALMYQPRPDTTFYASYIEAIESGSTVASAYRNANELLDPLKSKQYEIGVKTDRQNWGGSMAVFRVERAAEYGNSAGFFVQDGEQRYQGVELNGHLNITANTELSSSSTWLDATFIKSSANLEGNEVAGVPRFQQVLQVSHKVAALDGLKLYADAHYYGATKADTANNLDISDYTLFSAGASYRLGVGSHDVTLRAALDNITDHKYWGVQRGDSLYVGAPRTLSLNVSFDY